MQRLVVALCISTWMLLLPTRALARMMEHYDLTSLAMASESVVRVHETDRRRVDEWTTMRTFVVEKTYKGGLAPGASFQLSYDLYAMAPFDGRASPPPEVADEMVMFLTKEEATNRRVPAQRDGGKDAAWMLVPSGLRIFLDGKAHRFEQWNNPGGYVPVPQRLDPFDLFDDPRAGAPLDQAGLERAIVKAIARAHEIEGVLQASDSPERRRRLIDFAGPETSEEAVSTRFGFYSDAVAARVIVALAATGDLPRTLEAMTRAAVVDTSRLNLPFPANVLLDAARDPKLPLRSRVAALRLTQARWFELREMNSADVIVNQLLDAREPELRQAALAISPTETPSPQRRAAILRRFATEPDDGVRIAVYDAAVRDNVRADLIVPPGMRMPIISVTRQRDVVTISWADVDTRANWMLASTSQFLVTPRARAQGPAPSDASVPENDRYALPVFALDTSYSNGARGDLQTRLSRLRSSEPVEVELQMSLEAVDSKHPAVQRTISLGTFTPYGPARSVGAPVGANVVQTAAADAGTGADAGGQPSARPGARCGCDLVGSGPATSRGGASAWICLSLVASAFRRRKAVSCSRHGRAAFRQSAAS